MENTWNKDITIQKLEIEKKFIEKYISGHSESVLIKKYFDEFRDTYIYNTNAIEGNPITEYDTAYILKSNTFLEEYSAKDNMEVIGSGKAWDYILQKAEISEETIKFIHKNILFFDVEHAGIYRSIPVHIGGKQMPPPEKIAGAMEKLTDIIKNEENLFEKAAKIHLMFENIHPFIDGNGRTGRMLLNLQLLREGWLPINIKKNESGKYYRCFRQFDISKEKGIQEMFNLITKYEYEELLKLRSLIEKDLKKIK